MDPSKPKENANPTIRTVEKERSHARRAPFEWNQLGSFTKVNSDNDSTWVPNSAEDKAILKALLDISKTTHGKGVALLENVGLTLPKDETTVMGYHSQIIQLRDESKQSEDTLTNEANKSSERDIIDAEEVFDIIRNIQDPEHPNSLEQLAVVSLEQVEVNDESGESSSLAPSTVKVRFTPTIPHCSMATLIGLSLTVKLMRSLPARFKISVQIEPGTHASENAINKQLRDKERICAALENKHLAGVVNKCIKQGAEAPH